METQKIAKMKRTLPVRSARRLYRTFRKFAQLESSGGIVLMVAAVIALVWANSPWAAQYFDFWHTEVRMGLGSAQLTHDLHWWINEALMVLFFFVVGLEIKREILVGELSSLRQAALPIAAALGGMLIPALIFTAFTAGQPGQSGWGIPMATDIAFALGVMALIGSHLPVGLKIFLTALAIVDDIGAVLVIALFYSANIQWIFLAAAGVILLALLAANQFGVRSLPVYGLLSLALWWVVLNSGIHATIAGVLAALLIPASRKINSDDFLKRAHESLHAFRDAGAADRRMLNDQQQEALFDLETMVEDVETPLQRLEHALHPWVTYAIIPLFALANAGVALGSGVNFDRVSLGVAAGLVLGKQVGVLGAAWLAVRARISELPENVTWLQIYAAAWLAGIGFTMSLFISELAFGSGPELESAKLGILLASLLAGGIGYLLLRRATRSLAKEE